MLLPASPSKHPIAGTATEAAGQRSHTQEWADNLVGVVAESEQLVVELEKRFSAVLRPNDRIEAEKPANNPEAALVPLADHLRQVARRIDAGNDRLRDILRRSEL